MTNIYELHKYVRSSNESGREENLLTGILCWAFEHNNELLPALIERVVGLEEKNEGRPILSRNLKEIKLDTEEISYKFQKSLSTSIREGIADFEISCNKFVILGENKVVPVDLTSERIQKYFDAALKIYPGKDIFILCITPDIHEHILTVFKQIEEKNRNCFYWLSWKTIWEICDYMVKRNENNIVLNEVKEAINMAGLKPFEGFNEDFMKVMWNIHELGAVYEFFTSCDKVLTDSTRLGLKSEGPYRSSMEKGKIYPHVIYRYYFGSDWTNVTESNLNVYCIEFFYGKPIIICVSLWFQKGKAYDNFIKIQDLNEDLLKNIKDRFPDDEVVSDYDNGHFFGVKIKITNPKGSKTLIEEIERIISFLNNDTVARLENAGYHF